MDVDVYPNSEWIKNGQYFYIFVSSDSYHLIIAIYTGALLLLLINS